MKKLLVMFSIFCAATTFAMGAVVLFQNGDPIYNATFIEESGEYVIHPNSYIQLDLAKIAYVEYYYQELHADTFTWIEVAGNGLPTDFPGGRIFFDSSVVRIKDVSVVGDKEVPTDNTSVSTVKTRY